MPSLVFDPFSSRSHAQSMNNLNIITQNMRPKTQNNAPPRHASLDRRSQPLHPTLSTASAAQRVTQFCRPSKGTKSTSVVSPNLYTPSSGIQTRVWESNASKWQSVASPLLPMLLRRLEHRQRYAVSIQGSFMEHSPTHFSLS